MKILGYNYTLQHSDQTNSMGQCNIGLLRILIDPTPHSEQQLSTVLHEIIEALNIHLKTELEENQICRLEAGLYQVLTDNGVDLSPLISELDGSL